MISVADIYPQLISLCGAFLTVVLAVLCSYARKNISLKTVLSSLGLELLLLFFLLKTSYGKMVLTGLIAMTHVIDSCARQGITFVFGALATPIPPWGFVFGLHVLPIIIFFSALIAALSYLGVVDFFIRIFSYVVRPLLGTSSPETASALARSFLGPTESQLVIRGYLASMTDSELFAVMVSGLSMVSVSVFVIYMQMGAPGDHLIAAHLMGIPGSLLFAKIIMPAGSSAVTEKRAIEQTGDDVRRANNLIESIIQGTLDGLQLIMAIGSLLISFLALIELLNVIFVYAGSLCGVTGLTFQNFVGYLFAPCGFLMGVPYEESFKISELIGIKFLANEMVAFAELAGKHLSERGLILATYALCGFSNIATMGIVVGGLGTLIPTHRSRLSELAWHALCAATLSNLFSAYLVGIFL